MLTSAIVEARMRTATTDTFSSANAGGKLFSAPASLFEPIGTNDNPRSIEEELALRLAAAQRELSLVSMYLSPEFRNGTMRQLTQLVDPLTWDEDDAFLDVQSFRSFARAMALLRPRIRPMLGLSARGNTLAMWGSDTTRLSFEHLIGDEVKWFINSRLSGEHDLAAGMTSVGRLARIIDAHGVSSLLYDAG